MSFLFISFIYSSTELYSLSPINCLPSFSSSCAVFQFFVASPADLNSPVFSAMLMLTATKISITIIVIINAMSVIPFVFFMTYLLNFILYNLLLYLYTFKINPIVLMEGIKIQPYMVCSLKSCLLCFSLLFFIVLFYNKKI